MKTALPLSEYPGAGRFLRDYAVNFARVASWFSYDPHDPREFTARLEEIDARPQVDRGAQAAALADQQDRWRAGTRARMAALSLAEPGTYALVGGQQAGLFGGPLYTQLKAVSLVKLARILAVQFPGRRFIPTFWMASGDSDYQEVRTTHLLDRAGSLREIALPEAPVGDEGLVIGARRLGAELAQALDALDELLPGGEERKAVLGAIREDYATDNMVEGFARWMARLFAETELVLVDPQDPALCGAARELILRELELGSKIEAVLRQRGAELSAAGYDPQVVQLPGETSFFLLNERGRREKVERTGGGFKLKPSGSQVGTEEMQTLALSAPERFVAGVMLRPLYQNTLFAPAVFVGGPGEIAYRAQVTAAFELHGQQMAPALPRTSATVLPPKSAALLDELGLELGDCFVPEQDLVARVVEADRPREIGDALERYRALLVGADDEVRALAASLDPSLDAACTTLRGNLERHVDKLEKKVTSALKRRAQARVERVARLHALVYPNLVPQERILSLLSFLPRQGFAVIAELLDNLAVPCWEHQVIILD